MVRNTRTVTQEKLWKTGLWTGMFFRHGCSLQQTTLYLKQAGFECAELCECYASAILADGSWQTLIPALPLTQCHAPRIPPGMQKKEILSILQNLFLMLEHLGIGVCVFHPFPEEELNDAIFREAAETAGSHHLRIALENLIGSEGRGLARFLDAIPGLGVNIDSAHACANQEKTEDLIRFFGAKVYGLHLSDSDGGPADLHRMPGTGIINWQKLLLALEEIHYTGDLHFELPHERRSTLRETLSRARESAEAIRNILNAAPSAGRM